MCSYVLVTLVLLSLIFIKGAFPTLLDFMTKD